MSELSIGEGTQVTLHFSLKLSTGELVDTTTDKDPATFTVGDGNLFENFEKALSEMRRVSKGTVLLSLPHFGPPVQFMMKIPFLKALRF